MNWQHIEYKYGLQIGDDWLSIAISAAYKRNDRVTFRQGSTVCSGVVLDTKRNSHFGEVQWMYLVQYEGKSVPRWTLSKWLSKA